MTAKSLYAYETIKTKEDFLCFLSSLAEDYATKGAEWENNSIDSFLSAMKGYLEDTETEEPIQWQDLAHLLLAAKVYE